MANGLWELNVMSVYGWERWDFLWKRLSNGVSYLSIAFVKINPKIDPKTPYCGAKNTICIHQTHTSPKYGVPNFEISLSGNISEFIFEFKNCTYQRFNKIADIYVKITGLNFTYGINCAM